MMSSCSKDSLQDSSTNENFEVSYQLGENPWNENNPHDSLGYHHNEVLKMFYSAYGDISGYTIDMFEDSLLKVLQQYPFFENPISLGFDINEVFDMMSYNVENSNIEYDYLLNNLSLSTNAKAFLEEFVSGVTNSDFQNYHDFKNYVITNEEYLISHEHMFSSEEMFMLLNSTSVARHSGYLWHYEEEVQSYGLFCCWITAGADLIGAAVGVYHDPSLKGAGIGAVTFSAAMGLGLLIF